MAITIKSQVVSQGSYGLRRINRSNGTDIGTVMTVWHVHDTDKRDPRPGRFGHLLVGTYLTRTEARQAAADYRSNG